MERGRLKRIWMRVVKIDLKKCNLLEGLTEDKSKWRNRIRIADFNTDKALMKIKAAVLMMMTMLMVKKRGFDDKALMI